MNILRPKKRTALKFLLVVSFMITLAWAYRSGPPLRHTGGFGEPTCHECHSDNKENDGVGTLEIRGAPSTYDPGACYPVSVVLGRTGQKRWGFELAARYFSDDPLVHGEQAGDLIPNDGDEKVLVETPDFDTIQYIHHTYDGVFDGILDGPVQWDFNWCAPDNPRASVIFHVAGNAARGNDPPSPNGAYIYTAIARSLAPEP